MISGGKKGQLPFDFDIHLFFVLYTVCTREFKRTARWQSSKVITRGIRSNTCAAVECALRGPLLSGWRSSREVTPRHDDSDDILWQSGSRFARRWFFLRAQETKTVVWALAGSVGIEHCNRLFSRIMKYVVEIKMSLEAEMMSDFDET